MKVLIIDNDASIREGLKILLEKLCLQVTSINQADGVATGLEAIAEIKPDVVFLDVEMDDGTGMDLVKQLNDAVNFQLIFITAHNKYAVDAFKLSAIDFLLKPIDSVELIESIERAEKNIKTQHLNKQIQILQDSLSEIKNYDKKIALKDSESIYFIKVSDIIRCKAEGPYTEFYLNSNQKITISKSLKEYEELLEQFGFIRTHHSHLINIKHVSRFDKMNGGTLVLDNKDEVPVSQRKREQILELLNSI